MTAGRVGVLPIAAWFFLTLSVGAEEVGKKPDFKIQGRIGLGLENVTSEQNQDLFELRLGVKTKRRQGVRAYVELKADENSRETRVHEGFVDYKSSDEAVRIRGGRGKKVVGFEYEQSSNENLSMDRSLTYRYLEDRGVVGRDFLVGVAWTPGRGPEEVDSDTEEGETPDIAGRPEPDLDGEFGSPARLVRPAIPWRIGLFVHSDESNNSAAIASVSAVPFDHWKFGSWAVYHTNRTTHSSISTYQATLSGMFERSGVRAAVELFGGRDPYRSSMESDYGSGRDVSFGAAKAEIGLFVGRWSPYLIGTLLWRDLSHHGDRSMESILGMRCFVNRRFTFAGEYSLVENRSNFDATTRPYTSHRYAILARYYF